MPIPEFLARQGRCPSGLLGSLLGRVLAWESARENTLAVELLQIQPGDHVLEIGFAHGRTIAKAAALARNGFVAGVDPSGRMVRMATRYNKKLLKQGRVELRQGVSHRLPFSGRQFDKVYCVHTIYFWAQPVEDLQEIARVMKPGGRLVLAFRPKEDEAFRAAMPASTHTLYTGNEVRAFLKQAGFGQIELQERRFSARRLVSFATARRLLP